MTIYISTDPGRAGAITIFDNLKVINILDIPQIKWGSKQSIPDNKEVIKIFRNYNPEIIIIERIHTAPTDGVASAGNFLMGFGILIGCMADYRTEYVSPSVWKCGTGIVNKPKKAAIKKALERHPEAEPFLTGFENIIDRSDSVLLGHYYLKIKEKLR